MVMPKNLTQTINVVPVVVVVFVVRVVKIHNTPRFRTVFAILSVFLTFT